MVKDFTLDTTIFPSFTPLGTYVLSMHGYDYTNGSYYKFFEAFFYADVIAKI